MAAAESGQALTIDLETQTVLLPDGEAIAFDIDPYRRRALMLGLDEIGSILEDDGDDIRAFEARHRSGQPWLFLDDGRLERLFAESHPG